MRLTRTILLATSLATISLMAHAGQSAPDRERTLAHDVLAQMVGENTTSGTHGTTALVEALAKRFLDVGFPADDVHVVGGDSERQNLVVRLQGRDERPPILLMAHLDVIPVNRELWHYPPFKLTRDGGYFYGRGTIDTKGAAAGLVATFIRFHREGFKPKGDYILALTAGEEDGASNGVQWLLANRPDLVRSQYSINMDGGGPKMRDGKIMVVAVDTAEKVYASFRLTASGPGGHSSVPKPNNAIYRLAAGLQRLSRLQFPLRTNQTTRSYFRHMASQSKGEKAARLHEVAQNPSDPAAMRQLATRDPHVNALLRTTCVPTLLAGGVVENALPETASATINCRIFPGVSPSDVQMKIKHALADPNITVSPVAPAPAAPPTPINKTLFSHIADVAQTVWGYSIPVTSYMAAGASDSVFMRAAGHDSYVFLTIPYEVDGDRSHAPDERISVKAFHQSLKFDYLLLKGL